MTKAKFIKKYSLETKASLVDMLYDREKFHAFYIRRLMKKLKAANKKVK